MTWLFQPIPAAGQQQAAGAAPQPNGWHRPFEVAPLRVLIPVALVASGLIWCPQPIAASPSNSVTIDKWQQPLSKAVPVAQAIQGSAFVPFDTPQIAAAVVNLGQWQQPLSAAPKTASAVQSQSTFVAQDNPKYPTGWHQPFVAAVKTSGPVNSQPSFVVPQFNIPRGWERQLSTAPALTRISDTNQPFPFVTTAATDNTVTIDKWQSPLSIAVPVAKPQLGTGFVPFDTAQQNTVTIDRWQQQLSKPVPVAQAQQGSSLVPFNTAQTNTATIDKWLQPLSKAAPVAQAQQGNSFAPLNTAQVNTQTIDKWQQPLSVGVAVAQARQGNSDVPFNTVQIVPGLVTYDKYQQPLSVAVPVAKIVQTWTFVPFDTVQTGSQAPQTWQQPLSVAVKTAGAVHTALSFVAPPSTQYPLGWLQALSNPAPVAKSAAPQPTFVTVPGIVPAGWYQALSTAPAVAGVQQGANFVPLNAVQATPAGISGMAWFVPLGVAPVSIAYRPQQFAISQWGVIPDSPPPPPDTEIHQLPFIATMGKMTSR